MVNHKRTAIVLGTILMFVLAFSVTVVMTAEKKEPNKEPRVDVLISYQRFLVVSKDLTIDMEQVLNRVLNPSNVMVMVDSQRVVNNWRIMLNGQGLMTLQPARTAQDTVKAKK